MIVATLYLWSLPTSSSSPLAWDRGKGRAEHKRFAPATDAAVYFCDPQSLWQRDSNENANRLLLQYFPKGTNLGTCLRGSPRPFQRNRSGF